ncbi:MAG: sulfatase-like hydrolase/transferase [Armatimonadetes bacterium]|nr:sulfatase-like hydrolase/transferase [Armatimonadota bacterium]
MEQTERPNIVFFFTDQQRWDTLGCYGQKLPISPNIDRMAREGVLFENAFTVQPVCGPARAVVQTGMYATETGCFRNGIALPLNAKTIARYLSEVGYEVGYIGKWHLASDKEHNYRDKAIPPERRGGYKDYWLASDVLEFTSHGYDGHMFDAEGKQVEFKGYRVDCVTDFVLDYLRSRDRKKPFFLFVSYIEPHFQNDHKHFEGPIGSKEKFKDFEPPGDLVGTEGDWREEYPDYLGCCNSLDYNLGRIRAELKKLGLEDNTLIFYTSDHGCHFRTRNAEYKRSCHEASIRIPMLAYGPGFKGGKVVKELVSLIDVAPTILAAAGIEKPPQMRGRQLQDLVKGRKTDWPKEVFIQISESQTGRAIRTKRWKYSVSVPDAKNPASDVYYEEFLYDLENDPHERKNLVCDPSFATIRRELADILKRRIREIEGKEPLILPASG